MYLLFLLFFSKITPSEKIWECYVENLYFFHNFLAAVFDAVLFGSNVAGCLGPWNSLFLSKVKFLFWNSGISVSTDRGPQNLIPQSFLNFITVPAFQLSYEQFFSFLPTIFHCTQLCWSKKKLAIFLSELLFFKSWCKNFRSIYL